jgi:hypothetical protein
MFEIVFGYGLLVVFENAVAGLRNVASAWQDVLLLERLLASRRSQFNGAGLRRDSRRTDLRELMETRIIMKRVIARIFQSNMVDSQHGIRGQFTRKWDLVC